MRDSFSRHRRRCAALVVAFVVIAVAGWFTLPSVGHGSVSVDGRVRPDGDLPVFVAGKDLRVLEASFSIEVPFFLPKSMLVVPDDCVERIVVNGVDVLPVPPVCAYGYVLVDISSAIRRGSNPVRVVVRNHQGRTALDVGMRTGVAFAAFASALLAIAATLALLILRRSRWSPLDGALFGLVLLGTALRTLYLLATPATVRPHDGDKHLDYIRYIATHWHLPPPHDGFEFYQPPLYYVLTAPLLWAETRAGVVLSSTVFHLQIVALILSVATLWIAVSTLREMLAAAPDADTVVPSSDLVIGGGLLAVFLSLVYFGARVNNDVLVQVTSFAGVALIVAFWKDGRTSTWVAFSLCVAAGLLTKSNTYVVIALGLVCLAARRETALRRKALLGAMLAGIAAVVAGWFVLRRFLQERGTSGLLVSNVSWLNRSVVVPNTVDALFGFHPLQVLSHPYNSPSTEAVGRELWEYFFRSSLFGEFEFGSRLVWLSRALLVLLALLGLVAVRGGWRSLRERAWQDAPVHALLVVSLACQFAFRVASPYVPSQDFRYSFLLTLPFAYFVTLGLRGLPRWPRRAAVTVWGAFVVCSASFVMALWVFVVP
jgi:hypothetical protein